TEDGDAPLYRVTAHAGHEAGAEEEAPAPEQRDAAVPGRHEELPAVRAARDETDFAPAPLPVSDPDATRIDVAGPPGWQAGRWVLVVREIDGEEREAFRLIDPLTTVGRRSDDPQLRSTVALRDVPH